MTEPSPNLVLVVASAVAFVAASFDHRRGRIPNYVTYPALLVAPFLHAGVAAAGKQDGEDVVLAAGASVLGALLCAAVPAILYRKGAIGGGDVKLLACVGALLGPVMGIEAEMYGIFAAVLTAPAKLAYEGKLVSTVKNAAVLGANMFLPKDRQKSVEESAMSWIRLGPPVFFGVAFTAYLHWAR